MRISFIFYCLLFLLIYIPQEAKSQKRIGYTDLNDSTSTQNIKFIINRETASTDSGNLFKKGFGYVRLTILSYNNKDTIVKYYLNPELSFLKSDSPDALYPDYYGFVENTLVVIYNNVLNELSNDPFSESDKRKIRKLIDRRLQKPVRKPFYDLDGKKKFTDKAFRVNYFQLHNRIYIYELKNKPPLVIKD